MTNFIKYLNEAEYNGKKVELEKPFRLSNENKKFGVYVKNNKDNVILVKFGDPNLEIKRDDPERRKAFRARHKCDEKKDKTTAGYWSCKMWESGKSVSDILNEQDENKYFLKVLKDNITKIPRINQWISNLEDNWLKIEKSDGTDPVLYISPFKEYSKKLTLKIEDDYGLDITYKQIPFKLTFDEKKDFNDFLKLIKQLIIKYGKSKY